MARLLRIECAGALYHVMNRGNRRGQVSRRQSGYELFLDRLGRFAEEFTVEILAYVLMPNHFQRPQSGFGFDAVLAAAAATFGVPAAVLRSRRCRHRQARDRLVALARRGCQRTVRAGALASGGADLRRVRPRQ